MLFKWKRYKQVVTERCFEVALLVNLDNFVGGYVAQARETRLRKQVVQFLFVVFHAHTTIDKQTKTSVCTYTSTSQR